MKLQDLIFADGVVKGYELSGQTISLTFKDYCGLMLLIDFHGVTSLKEYGSVYSFVLAKITSEDALTRFQLLDDDNTLVLEIRYRESIVSVID
jgi:hypothetical protein